MWTTPSYTPEFKQQLVEMAEAGRSYLSLEREFGPDRHTIKKWHLKYLATKEKRDVIRGWTKPPPDAREKPNSHCDSLSATPLIHGHTVLAIPDLHCPFHHPDALAFLTAVKAKYRPDIVVCLGDEVDFHSFSRYIPDPDGMSPGRELQLAIEALTPFYIEFPDVLVCKSNHTVRPLKKLFDAGLPAAFLPTYSKMLNAPDGWQWKARHVVDGVLYVHGDNGRSGQYAAVHYMKQAKQPVVIGHIHAFASVFYEGPHFGMNSGCLIDREGYAFKYAKGALLDVNLGCGIVIGGRQAFFLPMLLDEHNRWTGNL